MLKFGPDFPTAPERQPPMLLISPRLRLFALAIILAIATIPLAQARPADAAASANRTASGANTVIVWRGDIVSARGFARELVTAYRKEHKTELKVEAFSTISGIDAVIDGSADIAGSARGMHRKRETELALVFQPAALDAIVPVTHPSNPVNNITLAQLRQIFLGRITNWKDLGGADAEINLYSIAAPLDGLEYSFRHLLYRHGDQKIAAPRLYLNTSKLEEGIAIDPSGLGLSSLSNSYANKGMKMLSVEGISASTQSVTNGSYPLFITLYVVSRHDSPKAEAINDFVSFLDSPTAKQLMRKHQLVPYSEAGDVYALDGARLDFIDAAIVDVIPADLAAFPRTREPPPLSAPRATLESRLRIAPTAESTQKARENLDRAEQQKAQAADAEPVPAKSD
ncbi:substrate-binding domain-containing protein [Dokdonella sp.]|uniref:substrate-binding domain-containing protein n=1 Tax=Dokdonella sp. TaxID=2291710 RepID=UPI003527D8FA